METAVIITGHSRGLGLALTEHYLHTGCTVWGIARHRIPEHRHLKQSETDLADAGAVAALADNPAFADFLANAGNVILINNAGTSHPNALCGRQKSSDIAAAVSLNATSALILTNAVCAFSGASGDVRIAHISSGAGRKCYPGWSVYGATKAALDHHAGVVAAESEGRIRIASIAPGVIDTRMQADIRAGNDADFPLKNQFDNLNADGLLQSARDTAVRIAAMIAGSEYGLQVLRDVRE